MEPDQAQTRQISAVLDDVDGISILHTRVNQNPDKPSTNAITTDGITTATENFEITDSGWAENKKWPVRYAIGGVRNADFWLLVRRFNKTVFHLRSVTETPAGELDFNVAEDEDFSPNKLRAQVERLYMGVASVLARAKANFLVQPGPLFYILTEEMNHKDGSIIKPPAGLLGSVDSTTGAPQNIKGEALENEASNFVTGIAAIATNIMTDEDPQHEESPNNNEQATSLPDPNSMATKVATAKDKATGIKKPSHDKTKHPMEMAMWGKMRPLMHTISDISDIWERCANVALRGIPTDAQLTITLLREGERQKAPLIPPPLLKGSPSQEPQVVDNDNFKALGGDCPLGATPGEVKAAVSEDVDMVGAAGGEDHESTEPGSHGKKRSKLLRILKPIAGAGMRAAISLDKVRAKTGSETAKDRLGAASARGEPPIAGPVEFTGYFNGEKGFLYLTTGTDSPSLCFSKNSSSNYPKDVNQHKLRPAWIIPVEKIETLNKISGYGAKSKLIAGWALEGEIMDGIKIKDNAGQSMLFTAITYRDELFNRLCAIGTHSWEIC
ncbi:hypothetical protein F25303_13350 [Fusarium sp. NRRL 25303]|nr:hypothetical protein F25303_13350 [Fusarium sp. NRRL 25303]